MITFSVRRLSPLLLIGTLLIVACRNDPPPPGVGEQAILSCTADCTARGQCGTLTNNQAVVLANEAGPSVKFQDRYFPNGTVVTLIEVNQRDLIAARDGVPQNASATPFPHNFFRAQDAAGKTAWVSSWCVARPES